MDLGGGAATGQLLAPALLVEGAIQEEGALEDGFRPHVPLPGRRGARGLGHAVALAPVEPGELQEGVGIAGRDLGGQGGVRDRVVEVAAVGEAPLEVGGPPQPGLEAPRRCRHRRAP